MVILFPRRHRPVIVLTRSLGLSVGFRSKGQMDYLSLAADLITVRLQC